jgi:hypothetical protein
MKTHKLIALFPKIENIIGGNPMIRLVTHHITAPSLADAWNAVKYTMDFDTAYEVYGCEVEGNDQPEVSTLKIPYLSHAQWIASNVGNGAPDSLSTLFKNNVTMAMYFERTMVVDAHIRRPAFCNPLDHTELYGRHITLGQVRDAMEVTANYLHRFWGEKGSTSGPDLDHARQVAPKAFASIARYWDSQGFTDETTIGELQYAMWEIGRKELAEKNKGETLEQVHQREFVHKMHRRGMMDKVVAFNLLEALDSSYYRTGLGYHPDDEDSMLVAGLMKFTGLSREQYDAQTIDSMRKLIWEKHEAQIQ